MCIRDSGSTVERSKNVHELYEYLSLFKNFTVEDMFKRLSENDVPCSKNLTLEEVITNQQVTDNKLVKEKETIHQGKMRMIRYPALFDDEKYINDKPAPKLGEDNEILLK